MTSQGSVSVQCDLLLVCIWRNGKEYEISNVSDLQTNNVHHPMAGRFREWSCVHKRECREERHRQTIVEGQKAFFTKHDGISCRIKTCQSFHASVSKAKQCIIVKMSLEGYCQIFAVFQTAIFSNKIGYQRFADVTLLDSYDTPEFIKMENCPPNSPDIGPVVSCRGELCSRSLIIKRTETLITILLNCWDELSRNTVKMTVGQLPQNLSLS